MRPNKKLQQLSIYPENNKCRCPPSSIYLEKRDIFKSLWSWSRSFLWPFSEPRSLSPDQSFYSKKAEAEDNSLLPPRGTSLNLYSTFSGQHASTIWFYRDNQKKWDGVVRGYWKRVFFQGLWMGYLDDFIWLRTYSFFT